MPNKRESSQPLPPPLVTVVVPCFNYGAKIARALESVQRQSLSNFECFIVDDGSTDNSREVIEALIASDRRFHYIYQANQGVAVARNTGVFAGSAPYICCLDADDAIDKRFLETCVRALNQDSSLGIAYTGLYYYIPDTVPEERARKLSKFREGLSPWPGQWNYDRQIKDINQIPTCNVSRRDMWERLGGQRQRYAPRGAGEEDAEMWLRAGALGFKAAKVTDAGFFLYSWGSGQVSGSSTHAMTDYRSWHPWTKDEQHPFASYATPKSISHPVRQHDEPVISVVVPVGPGHHEEIVNVMDSLEAQTFRQWEVIVVWDSLPDKQFISWYERAFPFARNVYAGERRGAGWARNRGAEIARAPLLLFLDADDWLYQQCLSRMLAEWEKERAIIYTDYVGKTKIDKETFQKYGKRAHYYDDKTGIAVVGYQSSEYDCERAQSQPKVSADGYLYVWSLITALTPKEWHKEVGGFDESMKSWEDWDYWVRMARAGKCFVHLQEELVVYRFYTGTRREAGLQGWQDLIQYLQRKYEESDIMPCSKCSEKKKPPIMASRAVPSAPQTERKETALDDKNYILCEYTHPNRGDHRVFGGATRQDYGYRGGGAKFYVHITDVRAQPHLFKQIQSPVVRQEEQETKHPAPPKPIDEEAQPAKKTPISKVPHLPKEVDLDEPFSFERLPGVTSAISMALQSAGLHTLQDLKGFGVDNLVKIKGIGVGRARVIMQYIESIENG